MDNSILNLLDTYAGPVFALVFFCILGYIFYWLIVIAPRRIKKRFSELQIKGYKTIESEDRGLKDAISQIAPVYPVGPPKDQEVPSWTIRNAIKRYNGQATKFIAHVSRLQGFQSNARSRVTIIFIEKRKLDINGCLHITPKQNQGNNLWEDRYGASLITDSYEQKFLDCYDVYSPDDTPMPLPGDLSKALIDICPIVCRKELFCFQGGINLIFSSGGWGICPANIVYKESDFTMMLDIFDKISNSLH